MCAQLNSLVSRSHVVCANQIDCQEDNYFLELPLLCTVNHQLNQFGLTEYCRSQLIVVRADVRDTMEAVLHQLYEWVHCLITFEEDVRQVLHLLNNHVSNSQ